MFADRGRVANVIAVVLALAAAVVLLPAASERIGTPFPSQPPSVPGHLMNESVEVVASSGPQQRSKAATIGTLFAPTVLSAVPFFTGGQARPARMVVATALSTFCFLGLLSIGPFYLPAALTMWIAFALSRRPHWRRRTIVASAT